MQLEITKVELELAKISAMNTAPSCIQVQNSPECVHASPDLPFTNYLAASMPLTPGRGNFPNLKTPDPPEGIIYITKPLRFLQQRYVGI